MTKKKKLTFLESYLKELYLLFIEPAKSEPEFWERILLTPEDDYDARQIGDFFRELEKYPTFESLLDAYNVFPRDRYSLYSSLNFVFNCFSYHSKIDDLLSSPAIDGEDNHILEAIGRKDLTAPGLRVYLDLRFSDALIKNWIDVIVSHYKHPFFKRHPLYKCIHSDSDWVLTTQEDFSDWLAIRINLSAGKMEIRKAVSKLLAEYSSRETVPDKRVGPKQLKTLELLLKVYRLHKREEKSFEDIAPMIGKSPKRTHSLWKEAYQWIQQEPLGTAKTRGETPVRIQDRVDIPLEEAEKIFARNQLTGEGSRQVTGQQWEDSEEGYDSLLVIPTPLDFTQNTSFDGWAKLFGNTDFCIDGFDLGEKGPPMTSYWMLPCKWRESEPQGCTGRKWFSTGRYYVWQLPKTTATHRREPLGRNPRCSTCRKIFPPAKYFMGDMGGIVYVSRTLLPVTYAGSGKIVGSLIQPDMVAEEKESKRGRHPNVGKEKYLAYWDWRHHKILEEIAFIRGYNYNHNYTNPWNPIIYSQLPRKQIGPCKGLGVAKNSKSLWRIPIAHIRQHEKVSRIRFDLSAECISDFSRKFTMRKDLLETYFVEGIDQGLLCSDKMEVPNRSPCLDCEWVNEDKDDCLASGCNKIRKFQQVLPELAEAA